MAEPRWILADATQPGEVRMASVIPGPRPILADVRRYDSGMPTFTDVLLRFERDTGKSLLGATMVLAIAGPTVRDTLALVHTNWTISRHGLDAMFGNPVTIINDVGAQIWALAAPNPRLTPIRGSGGLSMNKRARYVFVTVEEGVGTAILDIDDTGQPRVMECEGGHTDFAPVTEEERALAAALASDGAPSWEQALTAPQGVGGMASERVWNECFAGMLGRFVANQILSTGAWSGAVLKLRKPARLTGAKVQFDRALSSRRTFGRLIAEAPCWLVDQQDAVLQGMATMIAHTATGRAALAA